MRIATRFLLAIFVITGGYIFELVPLTQAETTYYLQFCAARLPGIDAAQVFTDEVVDDIYRRADGNFRMTNTLGEEAVRLYREDTSFKMLLEGVEERGDIREKIGGYGIHPS